MGMKLRFSEVDINNLANRYLKYQKSEGVHHRKKEDEVIGFKETIQQQGYLTKDQLYKVADWKLNVYGESPANNTKKNREDSIKEITRHAFTSIDHWQKIAVFN